MLDLGIVASTPSVTLNLTSPMARDIARVPPTRGMPPGTCGATKQPACIMQTASITDSVRPAPSPCTAAPDEQNSLFVLPATALQADRIRSLCTNIHTVE